jgi:hypothetical protein
MKTETVKDILQWTAAFHREIAACLRQCEDETHSERVRLLLDYLQQHEQRLAHVVERFEGTSDMDELNTWCFEFIQDNALEPRAACLSDAHKDDVEALFMDVMNQHRQLIELYRYLDGRFGHSPAHGLLEKLIDLEQHEAMQMSQSANRFRDL